MLIIENDNYSRHNPHWKFTLGPETYETRDTPRRVEVIKEALAADALFTFVKSRSFPERNLSRMHPYHDYIKSISRGLTDPGQEVYPPRSPASQRTGGGGTCSSARLPRCSRDHPAPGAEPRREVAQGENGGGVTPSTSPPSGPPVRPSGIRTPRTSALFHSAR